MGISLSVPCLDDNEKNHVEEAREISPDIVVPTRNFFPLMPDLKGFLDEKELGNPHQEAIPAQPTQNSEASLTDDRTLIVEKKLKRYRSQEENKEALECEEEQRGNDVSTELVLSLCNPYKIEKKLKQSNLGQPKQKSTTSHIDKRTLIVKKKVKHYRRQKRKKEASEREEEERCNGVSTELVLRLYDPYKIKKKLTQSDIGLLSSLLIGRDFVTTHLLRWMSEEMVRQVESKGTDVIVRDADTRTDHRLVFVNWGSSGSYVLKRGWTKEFVRRRGLAAGDEIGIYWDSSANKFYFSLLHRAN